MKRRILALLLVLLTVASVSFSVSAENEIEQETILLTDCDVSLSNEEYTYSNSEKRPKVTVSYKGTDFINNRDYVLEYKNNINAGTARVVVTPASNDSILKGKTYKTYKILKRDISSLSKKSLSQTDYIYSGSAKTPKMTVFGSGLTPILGTDYDVKYKNNTYVGIASVIVTGKGNYKGSFEKKFYIRPKKVSGISASQITDTTLTLKWNKVSGKIDGYRLYRYNSSKKKYEFAVSTKNNYFNVSGREPATAYTYMVRAYKNSGGKMILSDESSGKKVTMRPAKVTVDANSAYKGKYFVFKWKRVKANGYEIQYSKDKGFKKGVKKINIKSGKTTSKKVKISSKTKYYYRIRAYKTVNNKVLNGFWSDKRTTQFSNVYSSFSTTFNSPEGRTTNIKQACKYINGKVLAPGDVFSFNKVVGQRTASRGFKEATVYSGQDVTTGYGGGVCQVSTTIFNAALLGNLDIVERHQHSMKVHYVDAGRDAAISWGSADFKFRNSTKYDMKISAKVINNSKIEIKLLTNVSAHPAKTYLKVSRSGKNYTLTRTVSGKVNYRTGSTY